MFSALKKISCHVKLIVGIYFYPGVENNGV